MNWLLYTATMIAALGCVIIGGDLFPFSRFVMPALKRLTPAEGIAAMQSIDKLAVTPAFMAALFGTGVACLGLIVWAAISWGEQPAAALVLAGGALYLVGTVGVTMAANVPLSNMLAKLHPQDAGSANRWEEFLTKWTAWNHVRTIAALAAAVALFIAPTL